jgi:hypothetical protein
MILKERRPDCQKEGKPVVQSKKASGGCTSDPNPNLLTPSLRSHTQNRTLAGGWMDSSIDVCFFNYFKEQAKDTNVRGLHLTAVVHQRVR